MAAVSALLLAGYGSADVTSQGTSTSIAGAPRSVSEGVSSTRTVPSAEVSAVPAGDTAARTGDASVNAPVSSPTQPRTIPRLRGPRPVELPSLFDPIPAAGVDASGPRPFTAERTSLAAAYAPSAPSLLSSFAGLLDDGTVIPPDTMGAAGPNHLVSFLNSEVGFFEKNGPSPPAGTRLNPGTSLRDFWLPLLSANNLPDSASDPKVFDPKVIYDPGSGRFIAVTLDGRLPTDNSWVLLAVSRFSDPTLGWNTWALPADNTGVTWADYPGIGVDDNNVYLTSNLFNAGDTFQGSKIWRIPKPQLLALPQTTTLSWTEFTHSRFVVQPAHTFGSAPAEYFLTEVDFTRFLEVLQIAGTPPALSSLGTVAVSPYPNVLNLPVAPQRDIDSGDTRILNVVYRNGHLYATHTVSDGTNTKTEVAWYEIDPSPLALVQQGRVSDPTRFYYYPSIAVNANGDIALGFSGSDNTTGNIENPGAFYTAHLNSDPPGTTLPVGLLKAGEAPYFKTGTSGDNRWGDFNATVVDPTDDLTFWTIQEYAQTGNRWGTWWGSFRIADIVGPDNVVAVLDNLTVLLTWNDGPTEIGYVVERKTGEGGTFSALTIPQLPANSTSYTDNSGLSLGITYFYRVGAVSATSTGYSGAVQVATPAPPSSGDGGGCLAISRSGGDPSFTASILSVAILLLPAAALGVRRFSLRFARNRAFRHPAC
jgi:hypothetical protein